MINNAKTYNQKKAEAFQDAEKIEGIVKPYFKRLKDRQRRERVQEQSAAFDAEENSTPRINLKMPPQKIKLNLSRHDTVESPTPEIEVYG